MAILRYKDPKTGEYKSDIYVEGAVSSVNNMTGPVNLDAEKIPYNSEAAHTPGSVGAKLSEQSSSLLNTVDKLYSMAKSEDDTTAAYSKLVPAGAHAVSINMIGGKTENMSGALVSADVQSVASFNMDDEKIGEMEIPSEVRTQYKLYSAGSVYDSYEYEDKRWKYHKRVDTIVLDGTSIELVTTSSTGIKYLSTYEYRGFKSETLNMVNSLGYAPVINAAPSVDGRIRIHSGKIMIYDNNFIDKNTAVSMLNSNPITVIIELETPNDPIDITDLMPINTLIDVEAGGTITFVQSGTEMMVPNALTYYIDTDHAISNIERNVHTYLFDGVRLNDIMTDAEFAAAIAADDWRRIKVGDYWEIALNGSYYDWGEGRLPVGHTYYTDKELTQAVGTATAELEITFVTAQYGRVTVGGATYYVPSWDCAAVIVTRGAKYYSDSAFASEAGMTTRSYAGTADSSGFVSFEINGTTYYAKPEDCHGARIKTLSNAVMKYEIGGINPYWRYGDGGAITGNIPHVIMIPRDCLPQTGKMRRYDRIASWEARDVETILTANETPNGTLKKFTFTKDAALTTPYVAQFLVDGVEVEMSNTTISSNTLTCEVATAPVSGTTITCKLLHNDDVWHLTAAYHTLNDPDLGVLPLIKTALGETLAAKMYTGNNDDGMRVYAETRPGSGAASGSTAWANRGKLFMPTEPEVWGAKVYSNTQNITFLAQLPIFAHSQRHRSKGIGNGSGRYTCWVGSIYPTATHWCIVYSYGFAYYAIARSALGLGPSFLLTA